MHPIISRRMSPQNIGAARPLKRGLEELDKVISEKKVRAVSPLHLPKETSVKEKVPDAEGEGSKSLHGLHSGSVLESHKFPLSAPIFPGLYPGTLCTGLNNRLPPGYSHPLQYLKNQTVLSPLMQPLALHSLMVQRQFLTSTTPSTGLHTLWSILASPETQRNLLEHSFCSQKHRTHIPKMLHCAHLRSTHFLLLLRHLIIIHPLTCLLSTLRTTRKTLHNIPISFFSSSALHGADIILRQPLLLRRLGH